MTTEVEIKRCGSSRRRQSPKSVAGNDGRAVESIIHFFEEGEER